MGLSGGLAHRSRARHLRTTRLPAHPAKETELYKLFLTLRYLRKRRIAYFAIAAVTLCVAMVLIVLSVMGGWLDMVKKQARGLLGDIVVDNADYAGFPLYQEFIDEIETWKDANGRPLVAKATPVLYTWGLFNFPSTNQLGTVRIVGIRLNEVFGVNAFKKSLFYDTYYPGTTNLDEQRQPVMGPDPDTTFTLPDGGGGGGYTEFHLPALPAAYHDALQRARREGASSLAPDEVPSQMSAMLQDAGQPPIPGEYELTDKAGLVGDPYPGIIFGRDIVAKRMADGKYKRYYMRGELVRLTLWATSARGQVDPIPIKQPFRYTDDSRTGIYEIDSQHVYCDFDLLQKLLQMQATPRVDENGKITGMAPARCAQIQIKLARDLDDLGLKNLTQRLKERYRSYADDPRFDLDLTDRQLLSRVDVMTWQQTQAHIIGPVEKERILVTILFGIISLVAVALILCILYMIVLQKTRDIGIVKAIGGSSGGVAFIFVIYGAAVGIAGAILGTALGTAVVWYINEIQDFLIRLNPHWRVWDLSVYSFDRIPNEVSVWDALAVVAFAILASTLGSLGAAWRAGRMQPVEAIRHE
jgi:lipoprotein-releasing system permease protein